MNLPKSSFFIALYVVLLLLWQYTHPPQPPLSEKIVGVPISFSAYVADELVQKETYMRYSVVAPALGRARIMVYDDLTSSVSYGDTLTIVGTLQKPENKSDFDWVNYLAHRSIFYEIRYPQITPNPVLTISPWISFQKKMLSIKYAFSENLSKIIPEPAASLASGELLGERRLLPENLNAHLKTAGVSHIVVLSGYNITLVLEGILRTLSFLPRTIASGSALLGVFLFAMIAGFSPSVLRAALMASLLLLSRQTGSRYSARRALWIVALLMITIKPALVLYDASFQLSFLATAGILYGQQYFEKKFSRIPSRFRLREMLATTCAAQAAVLPLLIHLSGGIQLFSIPANILILPTVPPVMALSFLAGVLGFFSYHLSLFAGVFVTILLSYQISIITYIGGAPLAHIVVPHVVSYITALIYVLFFIKILWKEEEK